MKTTKANSHPAMLWAGRIIYVLCILFLLVDAIMKVVKAAPSIEGSIQLGWPQEAVQEIGIILLACTILYAIPATSILGAILLTGYLGGAMAIMMRAAIPGHPYLFPVIFGVLVWAALFLRDDKLRTIIPLKKKEENE